MFIRLTFVAWRTKVSDNLRFLVFFALSLAFILADIFIVASDIALSKHDAQNFCVTRITSFSHRRHEISPLSSSSWKEIPSNLEMRSSTALCLKICQQVRKTHDVIYFWKGNKDLKNNVPKCLTPKYTNKNTQIHNTKIQFWSNYKMDPSCDIFLKR